MTKLIVVLGGTGTQGASVIDAFLPDQTYKIRTITRDPTKASARGLASKGVEVVKGDIEDVQSLKLAFQGASVMFAVTDFWAPFFNPATQSKLVAGQTINEYCYDAELQHGKNIADAAATVASLDLLVFSSLSATKKLSKGKYTWNYHFDSKAAIVDYVHATHPGLAAKMSTVQVGNYADNWKKFSVAAPSKSPEGVYEWVNASAGSSLIPWVDARADTGKFVRALVKAGPGVDVLGVSQMVSYEEYMKIWAKVLGVEGRHRQVPGEELNAKMEAMGLPEVARKEFLESYLYVEEFGWDGGAEGVKRPWDLELETPLTTIEDYVKAQDWSSIIKQG